MNLEKKTVIFFLIALLFSPITSTQAGLLDDIIGGVNSATKSSSGGLASGGLSNLSLEKTVSGLKEALSVGTGNAVGSLSKLNGYFGNEAVKILMPEQIQNVANIMKKMGFNKPVDDFVMSMNQAAEKAADQAKPIFIDAIKEMSFDDAKGILNGGDTSATEYLQKKTQDRISEKFKPIITDSMNQVGVTKYYKTMMDQFNTIPFVNADDVSLDNHVTGKALDGLFHMVGQEELKIRTNPGARVTDLLKDVFNK